MHMPGGMDWIVILIVVVLLFGAKKIPDLAKGLGEGLREFKKAQREAETQIPDSSDKSKADEKSADTKKTEEKKQA
jgi:sec-independent protein translocase protein TatA